MILKALRLRLNRPEMIDQDIEYCQSDRRRPTQPSVAEQRWCFAECPVDSGRALRVCGFHGQP